MPGISVDGQDLNAVHVATALAVSRARTGAGPTLIEAKTYRFDEHCLNLQVPIPYRTPQELERYRSQRDPLALYRREMLSNGIAQAQIEAIEREVVAQVEDAVAFARQSPLPDPGEVYDYLFSNPIHYPPEPTP
jgi:pyruvate dehydrogenase E1 component alpha subunit